MMVVSEGSLHAASRCDTCGGARNEMSRMSERVAIIPRRTGSCLMNS